MSIGCAKLLPLFLSLALLGAQSSGNKVQEYKLKAVLIYKFLIFVEWIEPPSESTIVFGIVDSDPFGSSLENIFSTNKVVGKKVTIRTVNTLQQIDKCHILFIPEIEPHKLKSILKYVTDKPILLISDSPGFAEKGVHINFYELEDKSLGQLSFEINLKQVRQAKIHISSKLLKHAKIIE